MHVMKLRSCTVWKAKPHVSEIENWYGTARPEGEARAHIRLLSLWTIVAISWPSRSYYRTVKWEPIVVTRQSLNSFYTFVYELPCTSCSHNSMNNFRHNRTFIFIRSQGTEIHYQACVRFFTTSCGWFPSGLSWITYLKIYFRFQRYIFMDGLNIFDLVPFLIHFIGFTVL